MNRTLFVKKANDFCGEWSARWSFEKSINSSVAVAARGPWTRMLPLFSWPYRHCTSAGGL